VPPVLPKTIVELFAHVATGIDKTSSTSTKNLRIPHSWKEETHIMATGLWNGNSLLVQE
jgi:hypothetical protein